MKVLCREKNINIIDHVKNITVRHQNRPKLHLDLKDNKVLTETFTEAVSNILRGDALLPSLRKANDSGFHDCDE